MKRLSLLLLVSAFVLTQPAFSEDEAAQRAKQAAAARRAAHSNNNSNAVRQQFRGTPHLNQSAARQRRYIEPVNTRALMQAAQTRPRVTASQNATVDSGNVQPRRWNPNRNWQNTVNNNNNNNVVNAGDQNVRNTDSSTSVNDWQNRNGSWEGNRSRWDGNGSRWDGNRSRWNGSHNWDRQHRNRAWWRSHYTRFALFGGGYYYWNSGYWYPAYGYDPYFNSYSYDAPLYAYNDQDPGQVIADVQAALQRRGYDAGGVDGTYGPMTRRALLAFQRDNGLPVTGQIDQPTLDSLGFR
jgi:hypothetical protein